MDHLFPLSPTTFLERSGLVFSRSPAILTQRGVVTYGDLLRRSRRLAATLRRLDVSYGDRVGLLSDNCQEAVEAHYGIPGAGGVIVALDPRLSTGELVERLRVVGNRVLLVDAACLRRHSADLLCHGGERLLVVFGGSPLPREGYRVGDYEKLLATSRDDVPLNEILRDELDPIAINFASGASGVLKGAIMNHRAAYLHAMGQVLALGLTRESRYLWTLPICRTNGWGHIWASVAVGAVQVVCDDAEVLRHEDAAFVSGFRAAGVTHLAGGPRTIRRVLALEGARAALRGCTVIMGGALPGKAVAKELSRAGARLVHQLGYDETFGPSLLCEEAPSWRQKRAGASPNAGSRRTVTAIHAGTALRVLDADRRDVPADGRTKGELVISGNTVARGYFGAFETTAKAFVDGWFHSGEVAVVHPDGVVEIHGRVADPVLVDTRQEGAPSQRAHHAPVREVDVAAAPTQGERSSLVGTATRKELNAQMPPHDAPGNVVTAARDAVARVSP